MCVLITLNNLHFFKFMYTLKVYSFKSKQMLVTTDITKHSLRCKIKYVLHVFSKTKREREIINHIIYGILHFIHKLFAQ